MRAAVDCKEMDQGDVRRRLWWKMPVEDSWAAMEARWYCWVMHSGWSHHHSLSPPTRQHWQLNNREAGPSKAWHIELQSRTPPRVLLQVTDELIYRVGPRLGGPFYVPDMLKNKERPKARKPSKCLNGWSYRERLAKEAFWSPATRGWQKDSNRAVTTAVEAFHVPAHLGPPSCSTLTSDSCHRQKILHLCAQGHFGSVQLFATL